MSARKRAVAAWAFYELGATGFAMVVLSFHLPLDIASRVSRGSEKFSLAFVLSMVVVVLTAPLLGSLGDAKGKRRFLLPCVLLGVAGTACLALPGPIAVPLAFFAVANIAYQSAYVFYNALLTDVADESARGRVSGYGAAAGYIGSLVAMVLVLPFISGAYRAKLPGFLASLCEALSVRKLPAALDAPWERVNAYLPTALVWLLAALPLLFFARPQERPPSGAPAHPFREVVATLRSLPSMPSLLWFLVSSLLFVDVIHTVQIQMSTFSRFAVGLDDAQVLRLLVVCTFVAVFGGLLYGYLCQKVSIRTATLVALANWALVFALALTIRSPRAFYAVGILAGVGLGGAKVTSKLGLIALVPKERTAEFFGFYTLAGEAASIVGPLLWAVTLSLFPDKSPTGYRAALASVFAVLVFAVLAFLKVRFDAPAEASATRDAA
jgi:UMF1 family MFS transporter